jgi:hypothetical protein
MSDERDEEYDYNVLEDTDCHTCGGEGVTECDGDCPESDDCGCPYASPHWIRCPNCGGSGLRKDQQYW